MSEPNTLAHELRTIAGDDGDWVAGPISASVLREAADTIINLQDLLNEVANRWADAQVEAEVYARENMLLKAYNDTRWHELFGTPERAARTMMRYLVNGCDGVECMDGCPFYDASTLAHCAITSTDGCALLEWLRGDA